MKKRFFVVAAIIIGNQLQAQQDSITKSLNEVIVTATKTSLKQSQTGKVVTVIDRSTLDKSMGKDLAQLLTEQASIVINGATSNAGKDKSIFLRGAATSNTVILLNGVPVSDATGVENSFDIRLIPIEQIERVEIVKGAQSTLYGSNAVAGVINIITKKGNDKPFRFVGNINGGTYNTKNINLGISGTADGFSYDAGFVHREAKGLSEAKDTTALKTFDKDGFNQNGMYLNLDIPIAKGLQLKPFFRHQYFSGGFDDGAFKDANNHFTSSIISTGSIANYAFKQASITAQYQYDEISREYKTMWPSAPFNGRGKTAEIFGSYNFGNKFQALAGLSHIHQLSLDTNSNPKNPTINITAPYLSFFIKNISGFYLELGGRYNKHSKYGDNFSYSINPSYLINNNLKIFANLASAFKAPSLSQLYGQYGANKNLKPETSQTIEAGLQANVGILDVRAVGFYRKIKDVIIYNSAFTYENFDLQKDRGFEIEPTFRINKNLLLKTFYSFVDGDVTTKVNGKDSSYFNLLRRPKHSFGATIGYQITARLFVSTNLYNYGKREERYFDYGTFTSKSTTLKSYTVLNAYAEYSLVPKRLKIFADVKNILDADYYEVFGYSTQGTNVTAGITFKL